MHPRSKHWHMIDYVITRRRDIKDVHITRAMRGADCWTDHLLLRSKLSFLLANKHRRQKANTKKKLDVQKLGNPRTKEELVTNIASRLEGLPAEEDAEKVIASLNQEFSTSFIRW